MSFIDDAMDEYLESLGRMPVVTLVEEMKAIKIKLEEADGVKKQYQKMFDAIRLKVLPDKLEEEDISTMTVKGVGRISLQSDIYFSIPKANKADAFEWLIANGHSDLIQETVNSSSGKAWAKECIKEGVPLPDDIFKVTPFSRAQLTIIK